MVSYNIQKKRDREWFCTIWPAYMSYDKKPDDKPLELSEWVNFRNDCYEHLRDALCSFEAKHNGCKWAYAYHNRGVKFGEELDIDGEKIYPKHADTEHIHFVIKLENACSGATILKAFPTAHIETAITGAVNCANYLLHNTKSSYFKSKVPSSDLYCSGAGEHGAVWFPMVYNRTAFETFVPDWVFHYVYNEGCINHLAFASRFGASAFTPAYKGVILEAIQSFNSGSVHVPHIREVFDVLPNTSRNMLFMSVLHCDLIDCLSKTFDDLLYDLHNESLFLLERVYIWWKMCSLPATPDMENILKSLDSVILNDENIERGKVLEEFNRNNEG